MTYPSKNLDKHRFIWLIGENEGVTHDNNSFYFWEQTALTDSDIIKYYVLQKTEANKRFVKTLSPALRELVLWRDSLAHVRVYEAADMGIVTLSYLDVVPTAILGRKRKLYAQFPIVYLQHGVLGQKKIGYQGNVYNGNMFRFVFYNPMIKDALIRENGFKPSQLLYGEYMPRWKELVKRSEAYKKSTASGDKLRILWFITWREYKKNSLEEKKFLAAYRAAFRSPHLMKALAAINAELTVFCHRQMHDDLASEIANISSDLNSSIRIRFESASDADTMQAIATHDLLITDYSSLAYDFTFLGKPTLLFIPDYEEYTKNRDLYYEKQELADCSCEHINDLAERIMLRDFGVPHYFRKAFPVEIDCEYVKAGKQITNINSYLASVQRKVITFIGYNFWGTGGTVSATKALAEALFDKGFAVQLLSLKGKKRSPARPGGIRYRCFYYQGSRSRMQKLKLALHRRKGYFDVIKHDCYKHLLEPYAAYALKQYLDRSNSAAIISTRESFHSALRSSAFTGVKTYFWHTQADALDSVFPGIIDEVRKGAFDNSLFTTAENKEQLQQLGVSFKGALVMGNTLNSDQITSSEEMATVRELRYGLRDAFYESCPVQGMSPNYVNCISLLRFSNEHMDALRRIVEFGLTIRNAERDDIKVFVYGNGELLDDFIEKVYERDLMGVIIPMGKTNNPTSIMKYFDFMIDFSQVQSFGMPTIESVFNGTIPLVMSNVGSRAILEGFSKCYYSSLDELNEKTCLDFASNDAFFTSLHSSIGMRYSPDKLADKLIRFWGLDPADITKKGATGYELS